MKRKSYKIYTLGCKVNQYDSSVLESMLEKNGYGRVNNNADIAIINSCAVTKTAVRKGKRMLNKARRENTGANIVLAGCWPKAYPEEAGKLEVDLVWGVGEPEKLVEKIKSLKIINKKKKLSIEASQLNLVKKSRYFIKIQDGCEQFCSYCIIPYTRGKMRSRPENEVIEEIKKAAASGYKEIVLSGIHLGRYDGEARSDNLEVRSNLINLLNKIILISGLGRVRLSSIEVNEASDDLVNLIASTNNICDHLHIPLQSGSDKILKLMNRPYSSKYFINRINIIRKKIPDIAITTDIIVGFPGESEDDFNETLRLVKKLRFSKVHVFPFSAHEKTPAAKMPDRINKKIMQERANILRKIGEKYKEEYKNKFKNKKLDIIIENNYREKYIAKTEYYFDIELKKSTKYSVGSLTKVMFK